MLKSTFYYSIILILVPNISLRPKISKIIFTNEHYCNLLSPLSTHQIYIDLSEPNQSPSNSLIYGSISYTHPNSLPPLTSSINCNYVLTNSSRLVCIFKLDQSYTYNTMLYFYLKDLTIDNEMINYQNPSNNQTLQLHNHYAKHDDKATFQNIDFNLPNSNQFYIDYDNTIVLGENASGFTLNNLTGGMLDISQYCFTKTITAGLINSRVICQMNPRIQSLANSFYAVHYTDICGFTVNSKVVFNVKGIANDHEEDNNRGDNGLGCEEGKYWINQECKSECPEGTFAYNGTRECFESCDVRRLLRQDRFCVKKCSIGYGLVEQFEDNTIVVRCEKCIRGEYSLYEKCVNQCPYGSREDKNGEYCQLGPENPQYIDDYYSTNEHIELSCEEYNPCGENGLCLMENNIKICNCNKNYIGFYCDIENDNKPWDIISNSIFAFAEPDSQKKLIEIIDLTKSKVMVLIALIGKFLDQDSSFITKHYDILSRIPDATLNTLALNTSYSLHLIKDTTGVSNLISLSIKLLFLMLPPTDDNDNNERNSILTQIKTIILSMNNFLITYMQSMIVESTQVESYINKYISYLIWTDNTKSRHVAKSFAIKNKIAYADFNDCRPLITENKINSYLLLHLSHDIATQIRINTQFNIDTSLIYLSGLSYHFQPINLRLCPYIPILFPLKNDVWGKIDLEKYSQYKRAEIDIYNPYDKAFNDPCYLVNKTMGYDIPIEERRNGLYQNKTFITAGNNKCIYKELNTTAQSVWMLCGYIEDGFLGSMQHFEIMSLFDIGNKPLKCFKNITNDLFENVGFWIFISLLGLFITCHLMMFCFGRKGSYINDAYINSSKDFEKHRQSDDCSDNKGDSQSQSQLQSQSQEKDKTIQSLKLTNDNKPRTCKYCKAFNITLIHNIIKHHPLVTIFNNTIMIPIHYKLTLTFYDIALCFGLNALFYHEGYISVRKINDKDRQSFLYPLLNEYLKIVYSILVSFGFMLVIRGITFIPKSMQQNLNIKISEFMFTINRNGMIKAFMKTRMFRDIIAYFLMLGTTILYALYTISFCANYPHASITLVYSTIWTMLIIWIVISPLCIIIISLIEINTKCTECSNFIKKILPF